MLIRARNTLDQTALQTNLSKGGAASASTFYVQNINSFEASWAIQLGKTNEEKTEILLLGTTTPSGTTLTTTTGARFAHPTDTPVYAIKFNQMVFKRSTTGTSGTAAIITNGTESITPDSEYTQYDDTSAVSTYAYKAYYQNSVTGGVSSDSDWITTSGFSFFSLSKIRERIKRKLSSAGYIKYDDVIDDWINEWKEKMTNTAIDVNQDYSLGSTTVAYSGTTELGTITDTDFKIIRRVRFTSDDVNFYTATKMNVTDFEQDETFNESHPYYYMYGENIIGRKPNDATGTACILYYKRNTLLEDETDELPVSMQSYTKSFIDYGLAQAYYLDEKTELASLHEGKANNELERFRMEITPRTRSGPQSIKIVESIEGD